MLSLLMRILLVVLLAVTLSGCAAIAGIFKAGVSEQFDPSTTMAAIYAGLEPVPDQVIRPTNIAGVDIIAGSMAAARSSR